MMKIEEKEIVDPLWMGRFRHWPRWGGMRGKETTRMALVECILATWSAVASWDMEWGLERCGDGEKNRKKDVNLGRRVYKIVILF